MFLAVVIFATVTILQAPKINTDDIYSILEESTVMYDDEGNEIDTVFADKNRSNVEYKDLPENLVNAFIALEDKTFWDHNGFNFIRILGAIKEAVFSGGDVSGTSTLTQQLARNVFLPDEMHDHSIKRKIVEAYYTVILESKLEKDEIITAYLNTIYFGYQSYGVQAASQAYFSKDVQDLTLEQCAALAAIPQAPSSYQLIELVSNNDVSEKDENILKRTSAGTFLANDTAKDRRQTCLDLMEEQQLITKEEHDKASAVSLKEMLDPNYSNTAANSSYFEDYVIDQVIEDLMEKEDCDYDTAWNRVYQGGLKIYSTLDSQAQEVIETEVEDDSNYPYVEISTDSNGNMVNKYGQISLYDYDNYFDEDGDFTFSTDEIAKKDGSLIIKAGNRLNIYDTEVNGKTDYSIEFKNLYTYEEGTLYSINGGYINVPQNYKTKDEDGNVVIAKEFFEDEQYKDYFVFNDDGTVTVTANAYTLNQKVIQPQSAMAIVENSTGHIKALVGGRKTTGRRLHNRAISPRQPGSSIKPLGVYAAAIQQSAEEAQAGQKHNFIDYDIDKQGADLWGNYLTAGSIVIDEKTHIEGRDWPKNAGSGFSGPQTMRSALQLSINTCAVKIFLQVGAEYSADIVEKFGITTLDTEGGTNDLNPAALALGGMSSGVTPLEMASAYTVFPNNGTRKDTSAYTKVIDANGETILDNSDVETHEVLDSGVAWIMTDMLKSVVSQGIAGGASISGVQVGGKTGTTDDEYDIWFDGFTPNYSAALWIGVDQNQELSSMSSIVASLWGRIMDQIPKAKSGSYKSAPSNVIHTGGEYYISGTQGGTKSIKDLEKKLKICKTTGYLATPECPSTEEKKFVNYGDSADDIPKYYCYKHNSDPEKYPVSPDEKYEPPEVIKPEEPEEPEEPTEPEEPEKPEEPEDPEDPEEPETPETRTVTPGGTPQQ